jgi:hypothetical protein
MHWQIAFPIPLAAQTKVKVKLNVTGSLELSLLLFSLVGYAAQSRR